MKKIFSLLLAAIMMVIALTSCDFFEKSQGEENSEKTGNSITKEEWNRAKDSAKFNNVRVDFTATFISGYDHAKTEKDYFEIDGELISLSGEIQDDEDVISSVKNIYIGTVTPILDNFDLFTYNSEKEQYVSDGPIVYNLTVMGYDAKITAEDVVVKFNKDLCIASLICKMTQEFKENGKDMKYVLDIEFLFSNYGTTKLELTDNDGNNGNNSGDIGGDNNGNNGSDIGGDNNGDNNGNNNEDDSEDDVENVVRTTITEEEWEAMLGMKNYTQEETTIQKATIGDEVYNETYNASLKQTETSKYFKDNETENYHVIKNGKTYNVRFLADGTVSAVESSWTVSDFGVNEGANVIKYEDLKYDEEKKAYTCELTIDEMPVNYEFYFENGKIVKILGYASREASDGPDVVTMTIELTLIITDIGTTVVEVPEFTIENDGNDEDNGENAVRTTITEEEWEAMLGMKNFTQKITSVQSYPAGDKTVTITLDQLTMKSETAEYTKVVNTVNGGSEYYYASKNGKTYYLSVDENGALTVTETEWEAAPFGEGLDYAYEDLIYDEENKSYILNLNEDLSDGTYSGTYAFFFENGKVVKCEVASSYQFDDYTTDVNALMTFTNLGTTVVEVPEFTAE